MTNFIKLSDNEMNYYQFKAKQLILKKKEERDWQDFCKQNASDCATCLAEKAEITESKDVGIQTFPKKSNLRTDRTYLQPKNKSEGMPDALVNIMTRLEKIDLALSKLFDESHENQKLSQKYEFSEKKPFIQAKNHMIVSPTFSSQRSVNTFEEHRKLQIQNSLRASLQNSASAAYKKPPNIKPKNSSFFLPHDLEIKRAAARKAYLASLQTKPKVLFQNKRLSSNEKSKTSQSKKTVPARKKIFSKNENRKSKEDNEETIIEAFVDNDAKDENIEVLVDAIFEDLLGEAALDLNRIRQMKKDKYCSILSEVTDKVNAKIADFPCKPSTSICTEYDSSKITTNNDSGIMKLKSFIDSSEVIQKKDNLRKKQIEVEDKSTSTPKIDNSQIVPVKRAIIASSFQQEQTVPKSSPKFESGIKNIIKIDPEKAKDIASKRNRFWRYLESISQIAKGDFNPWILNESLAESILDECISDIAEELSEMPSSIMQDLYNREFAQQVEI